MGPRIKRLQRFLCLALIACLTLIGCQQEAPVQTGPRISPGVAIISRTIGLTPGAQNLFFSQNPQLIPVEAFYKRCGATSEGHRASVILGCFIPSQGQIWIQSITDSRLKGTMEVVAAHELLHAAYSRLQPAALEKLKPKLEKAFEHYDNPSNVGILKQYQTTNPDVFYNELHSYLGTELLDLHDPDLEQYFSNYFKNRKSLVELVRNSQNELYQFEKTYKTLKAEIDSLQGYIDNEKYYLESAIANIKAAEQALEDEQLNLEAEAIQTSQFITDNNFDALAAFDAAQARAEEKSLRIENLIQEYQNRNFEFDLKVSELKEKQAEYNLLISNRETVIKIIQNRS